MNPHIKGTDSRTRHRELYSAPARPAAETEVAHFIAALINLVKPDHVLELGTAYGHTAAIIGQALSPHDGHLDTIDKNPRRLREARNRCKGLPVTIHQADYETWTPPKSYDLVFFDSDRANRDREYALMKPYINPNAILLFHDAGEQHKKAVESLARLPLPSVYLPCPRGLVIACEPPR